MNTKEIQRNVIKFFENVNFNFPIFRPEKKILEGYVKRGDVVLDLCCGNGRISFFLAKKGCKVIGIDISKKLIKTTKFRAKLKKNVSFICGDVTQLNLNKNSFNCILLFQNSLEHIPSFMKRKNLVKKCYEWLKPGGYLITSFHSILNPKIFFYWLLFNFFSLLGKNEFNDSFIPTRYGKLYFHFFTPLEIKRSFYMSGFKLIKVIPWKILNKKHSKFTFHIYNRLYPLLYCFWIFSKC